MVDPPRPGLAPEVRERLCALNIFDFYPLMSHIETVARRIESAA
jgi:hypothetical protein